jgi:hypothetical protein
LLQGCSLIVPAKMATFISTTVRTSNPTYIYIYIWYICQHFWGLILMWKLMPIIYFLSSVHYDRESIFVKSLNPFCCLSLYQSWFYFAMSIHIVILSCSRWLLNSVWWNCASRISI